jgi:hypothetical protein
VLSERHPLPSGAASGVRVHDRADRRVASPLPRLAGTGPVGADMKHRVLATLVACLAVIPSADALAAPRHHHRHPTVKTVIRDCVRHERLTRRYPLSLLRRARRHLPADVREYTDCPEVLARAIRRARHHRRHAHHRRHHVRSRAFRAPTAVVRARVAAAAAGATR